MSPILTSSEGRHKPVPGGLTAAVLAADTLGQGQNGSFLYHLVLKLTTLDRYYKRGRTMAQKILEIFSDYI